jgi:hypothetical protein
VRLSLSIAAHTAATDTRWRRCTRRGTARTTWRALRRASRAVRTLRAPLCQKAFAPTRPPEPGTPSKETQYSGAISIIRGKAYFGRSPLLRPGARGRPTASPSRENTGVGSGSAVSHGVERGKEIERARGGVGCSGRTAEPPSAVRCARGGPVDREGIWTIGGSLTIIYCWIKH